MRGFFTAVHLAAPIGALKAAQQKSMSICLLLSQSLDGIFSWKNGLQSWSSKQIKCMLEEQRQKDASDPCSFSDLFALYSPSDITSYSSCMCHKILPEARCGAFKIQFSDFAFTQCFTSRWFTLYFTNQYLYYPTIGSQQERGHRYYRDGCLCHAEYTV